MLALCKAFNKRRILQFFLIIDGLIIHMQTYMTNDYSFMVIGLTLACFHLIIYCLEQMCQKKSNIILMILCLIKGIVIIGVTYILIPQWQIYAGIQIVLIIQLNEQYLKLTSLIFFLACITCICFGNISEITIEILRAVVNFFLIVQIYKQKVTQPFMSLKNLLYHISSEEFCILDMEYNPVYESKFFYQIAKEQVMSMSEQNQSRMFTPRDQTTNFVRQSHCIENIITKPTLLISDIIEQLKKKILKLDQKLIFEPTNNSLYCLSVQKLIIDNQEFILIIKHKFSNAESFKQQSQQQKDQVQTMIKTLHKVSHDMRNPLNAIVNMQMCLQELIDPSLFQKFLKPSLNSCHLLLNLINDILDAAQIENKSIRIVCRKFNLAKLIDKTISLFDLLKEKKGLNITFNYDPKLPLKINSDKLRIRQIIMNLLSNAVKYTQPKGSILIDCIQSEEKAKAIIISIQDSGMGIKSDNLKNLFQEFSRINDVENQKANPFGIGLGLMISNELAKLLSKNHSIGIQVQSEYGSGSKFYFEIENEEQPLEDISDSQVSQKLAQKIPSLELRFLQSIIQQKSPTVSIAIPMGESSKRIIQKKNLKAFNFMTSSLNYQATLRIRNESERNLSNKPSIQTRLIQNLLQKWNDQTQQHPPILIVDDNEFNIVALQYLLELIGISSDSAINGMISIEKVNDRLKDNIPFQLIFMDLEMPLMLGLEASTRIRKLDKNVTIIACSGHKLTSEIFDQFKDCGIAFGVEKPITKIKLKDLLLRLSDGLRCDSSQFSQLF
ncbi:unnamed protein product [Paramecium sonneborni]|uniref:Multi-sensor hybrid histidine kinase n=1 Tax=Paramecium sonneborni TaxID=65129 RepID=A0A8S1RI38_9CILI|nr:unnamed protein product [Paramecium sonneborni]